MIELAKFAKHHVPQEHEMDDPDFVDKRIWTLCKYGATSALAALAKTESNNMKELIARVLNAFCQHQLRPRHAHEYSCSIVLLVSPACESYATSATLTQLHQIELVV